MSLYTIVFIFVTILILIGISLFGILISKIDKWIDNKDRVGRNSIYKPSGQKPAVKTGSGSQQINNRAGEDKVE